MSAFPGLEVAIKQTLAGGDMPGMVVAACRGDGPIEQIAVGHDADGVPLTNDSLFPVTSITKLATALAIVRLVDRGDLALDDELRRWVPEDVAAKTSGTTIRALLTHSAGLPFGPSPEPAWTLALGWSAIAKACLVTAPVTAPGTRVEYSNTGFCLLGIVLERRTGLSYPEALRALVLAPLTIDGYIGEEPPRNTATVRNEADPHAGTELAFPNSRFSRALGTPDGGLVTTASGALALARVFAGWSHGFLSAGMLADARRDQTGGLGGGAIGVREWPECPWGLGIELLGHKSPHPAPSAASPGSFGHVGATGCMAWVDLAAGIAWAWMATRMMDDWIFDPSLPIKAALYATA